jgi:hypothetical protein
MINNKQIQSVESMLIQRDSDTCVKMPAHVADEPQMPVLDFCRCFVSSGSTPSQISVLSHNFGEGSAKNHL